MNLEDLTKSQLLLLTILVNFVTSVATGILTVSLLDQAPPIVTQTVNRIVEHTVETVTQAAPAAVIQAPQPSVEDLITAAFSAADARIVGIYAATSSDAVGQGIYLPKSRAIVTSVSDALPKEAFIKFGTGEFIGASLAHQDATLSIYGFADNAKLPGATAPVLLAAKDLKVGQTALAFAKDGNAATGIISRVSDGSVHTTLPETKAGAAAVDLSGNIIGIFAGDATGVFVSADHIRALLTATSSPATP